LIICITGPTGIGKTRLSISLAKKYDAIIINADATQIYKELNIGSAKITEEEKENINHFLFDIKNPDEQYSVCDYQIDARNLLKKYQNKNIIVVGGTGLYLKALFYDYNFSNKKNNDYENYSNEELYNMAKKKDSNINIHPNNKVRLINFLNSEKKENNKDLLLYANVVFIGLTLEREKIYEIANNRVDVMMKQGLLEEVKALYEKYPSSSILKRAIGYKELISYLNKEISLNEAVELIKKNTRHYIKRQYTWFNNQMDINFFKVNLNDFDKTIYEISSFIDSLNSK